MYTHTLCTYIFTNSNAFPQCHLGWSGFHTLYLYLLFLLLILVDSKHRLVFRISYRLTSFFDENAHANGHAGTSIAPVYWLNKGKQIKHRPQNFRANSSQPDFFHFLTTSAIRCAVLVPGLGYFRISFRFYTTGVVRNVNYTFPFCITG